MNEHQECFFEEMGDPTYRVEADTAVMEQFCGILPDAIFDWWKIFGWSGFKQGRYWITNPLEYTAVLNAWLKDTPFEQMPFYVLARGAFGELHAFCPDIYRGGIDIGPQFGRINPFFDASDIIASDDVAMRNKSINAFFAYADPTTGELKDDDGASFFERMVERWGDVGPDEMYTQVPCFALGGDPSLETIKVEKLVPQCLFLASTMEKRILRFGKVKELAERLVADYEKNKK